MSEKRRRGLGKGLGALIPTTPSAARPVDVFFPDSGPTPRADDSSDGAPGQTVSGAVKSQVSREESNASGTMDGGAAPVVGAYFTELPIDNVHANANQPRQVFDEDDIAELAASIREVGVLQPIVVRPAGDGFEIVMGERRWRATRLAGLETVPAIVRETSDTDLLRDALLENLHRAQLNPLEEAAAYQQLLEDFGCTHEELATRIARSRPQISNMLRLLRLPPAVQRRVAAGVLSAGHARALLGLTEPEAMERLAHRIVAEGLSVRATEEIVALGDADEPMRPELRRRPRVGAHAAELDDLSRRLSDRWDTKVKIALGQRKGRIAIEFAGVDDLNRIMEALAPQEASALKVAGES